MRQSSTYRWIEIALWSVGIVLLGTALMQTVFRWNYQAQQTRALEERGSAIVAVAPVVQPLPSIETEKPEAPVQEPVKRKKTKVVEPAFARIEIPRLGVSAIVEEGTDEKTLARAVGLVDGSARPGELGNMVLAGHRDTFFRPLRKVRVNDRIRMVVPPNTYEYEVTAVRVVEPEETSVLASRGVEELTLVTCYPFRFVGPAPERFIVSAARID